MADRLTPTHLTLRLLRIPTRSSLAAAHGVRTESFRLLTVVGVHIDNDVGAPVGWGECSALSEPGYTSEWAEGAFDLLRSGSVFDRNEHPMAAAALEMAILDAELKASGESLADRLGTADGSAPAGAVVGLAPLPTVLNEIEELASAGYGRIKCKIAPGRISSPIKAVRSSFPDLELHVDANASLTADDMPELLALQDLGVRAVEQPFAVGDHGSAAKLVAGSELAVVADEAITAPIDVDDLAIDRAATAVAIKPSKLGGLPIALHVLDRASAADMQCSIGGMLESGLGRHLLAALAPLPGFMLTGDLSPAKRWLVDDPFRDLTMKKGEIQAPSRPGIAGEPIKTRLDRHTVRKTIVSAQAALTSL